MQLDETVRIEDVTTVDLKTKVDKQMITKTVTRFSIRIGKQVTKLETLASEQWDYAIRNFNFKKH